MRTARRVEASCDLRRSVDEPAAFSAFYREHATRLLAFVARRTFDVEVARDLTAEAFAQAFRSRRRFRGTTDDEAAAWLYAIARHLLSRYVRRGVVERRAIEQLGIRMPALEAGDYERVVQLAGLAEIRAAVSEAFERLRPDQRDAVRLRVIDELSYGEIAARLAISEPNARARVSRGLRQLAEALEAAPQIPEVTT
jgi:RNA polymerase sigma-70 factor, ECF subfamily